jgi:hypothetical protein
MIMPRILPTAAACVLLCFGSAAAQDAPVRLDVPIVDAPYNFAHGLRGPSMSQSLAVTEAFYEVTHGAIRGLLDGRPVRMAAALILFDFLTVAVPGAAAWQHEEFHRAVMGNRGIDSFNDVYRLNLLAETIAVSRVRDEDLERLKADHPAEQARLSAAGLEGETLLTQRLARNMFMRRSGSGHIPFLWQTRLSSLLYVWSGHTSEAEELTIEMNERDGASIRVRDFTGHDFTAWSYDLHRPGEPYAERGVHPSGIGIDRYIKPSDMTAEELAYLKRQGRLQFLNFVDPHMFGVHAFRARNPLNGRDMAWHASLGHMLTSFGYTTHVNLMLQQAPWTAQITLHRYVNGEGAFPGLDAALLDAQVRVRGRQLLVSPRAALWLQPEGQAFRTRDGVAGGLAAVRVVLPSGRWGTFVEAEAKTAGWVAGVVQLEPQVGLRAGASYTLR